MHLRNWLKKRVYNFCKWDLWCKSIRKVSSRRSFYY